MKKPKGTLIIIGGHEQKATDRDRPILEEVARRSKSRKGPLLLITVASSLPQKQAEEYTSVFRDLGVEDVDVLPLRDREEATDESTAKRLETASTVFFTGGDQLRITSQVGDSVVYREMLRLYRDEGVTIVGTSAGAAAMPETMIISGPGDESNRISSIGMAPGLGLLDGVVVDSHFAERGRFGRLLGAVAQNPKNLGLGIDEDTAIVVDPDRCFRVIGSGGVYVVDGTGVTFSSLSDKQPEGVLSIFDVKLHVLRVGDRFDLGRRQPVIPEEALHHAA